jgi:hypothetical protein
MKSKQGTDTKENNRAYEKERKETGTPAKPNQKLICPL